MLKKIIYHFPSEPSPKKLTYYYDDATPVRANLFYLHGGGLLYGQREDLPNTHVEIFTANGLAILALDYPLAPEAKLPVILADLEASLQHLLQETSLPGYDCHLPYFLFGRSAGAYLCFLLTTRLNVDKLPAGLISYYGYGFLTDGWFQEPSAHYLALPRVDQSFVPTATDTTTDTAVDTYVMEKPLAQYYQDYVGARQQGNWTTTFYEGREKFFYLDYTLRLQDTMPCPLFLAHATSDPDVPYQEFQALQQKYPATCYTALGSTHDFDRLETDSHTQNLLAQTVTFILQQL